MGSVNIFFLVCINHDDLIATLCLFGPHMDGWMCVCKGTNFWWDDDCLPRIL
jgi:hypothetical protein